MGGPAVRKQSIYKRNCTIVLDAAGDDAPITVAVRILAEVMDQGLIAVTRPGLASFLYRDTQGYFTD